MTLMTKEKNMVDSILFLCWSCWGLKAINGIKQYGNYKNKQEKLKNNPLESRPWIQQGGGGQN